MKSLDDFDYHSIPLELQQLFCFIEEAGYKLVMVGGVVRDYLLTGTLASDIDIEIRKKITPGRVAWLKELTELKNKIENRFSYDIEELPYGIIRIFINRFEIEITSPRLEFFQTGDIVSHRGFSAELDPSLDYASSFKRRDFTINAIGVELNCKEKRVVLVDPFDGVMDLQNRLLTPCGADFTLDPVRFLRAVRFKLKLGCFFSERCMAQMEKMSLQNLTLFYFFNEFFKSKHHLFFKELFEFVKRWNIPVSDQIKDLMFLENIKFSKVAFSGASEFFVNVVFQNRLDVTKGELDRLANGLMLKNDLVSTLVIAKALLRKLRKLDVQTIVDDICQKDFVSIEGLRPFSKLYNVRKKIGKLWEQIIPFISNDLVKLIPEELSGGELFSDLIKKESFDDSDLSVVRFYAHLKTTPTKKI